LGDSEIPHNPYESWYFEVGQMGCAMGDELSFEAMGFTWLTIENYICCHNITCHGIPLAIHFDELHARKGV
jgi:hypothetical protein